MKRTTALKTILAIAIAGILFSGYLSYGELLLRECSIDGCSFALGLPVCVYGFLMYAFILIVSILGLRAAK